jgi:hypothetical protein
VRHLWVPAASPFRVTLAQQRLALPSAPPQWNVAGAGGGFSLHRRGFCVLTSDKATVDQVDRMNRETLERFTTKINPAKTHVGE